MHGTCNLHGIGSLRIAQTLGKATEEDRENDAGIAARATQHGIGNRFGTTAKCGKIAVKLIDTVHRAAHIRTRIAIRHGENIQIVDGIALALKTDGGICHHLIKLFCIDLKHRNLCNKLFGYHCSLNFLNYYNTPSHFCQWDLHIFRQNSIENRQK